MKAVYLGLAILCAVIGGVFARWAWYAPATLPRIICVVMSIEAVALGVACGLGIQAEERWQQSLKRSREITAKWNAAKH